MVAAREEDEYGPHPVGHPIEEEGCLWYGTREELEGWKAYKKAKARVFVERGYSVGWYPDADGWMEIYTPERHHANAAEIRAAVKFSNEPSQYGIRNGCVSKLTILRATTDIAQELLGKPGQRATVLYNYDRGLDFDHLHLDDKARALYDAIIEELN